MEYADNDVTEMIRLAFEATGVDAETTGLTTETTGVAVDARTLRLKKSLTLMWILWILHL